MIKDIHSLNLKKYRDESGLFVAEGAKVVEDLLHFMRCKTLFATEEYLASLAYSIRSKVSDIEVVDAAQLKKLSNLSTPRDVVAVFEKKTVATDVDELAGLPGKMLCLALDGVQDPGNLGTIIRLADWFGIEHIFASRDTADMYSPKVVQATMGAIARVAVHYVDLPCVLSRAAESGAAVYGTFLDGADMYAESLEHNGVIVMGNEGNGISREVSACVNHRLYIPPFPAGRATSESLNVAVATAVVCSEFRRRELK